MSLGVAWCAHVAPNLLGNVSMSALRHLQNTKPSATTAATTIRIVVIITAAAAAAANDHRRTGVGGRAAAQVVPLAFKNGI